jgi:hypothetical protein
MISPDVLRQIIAALKDGGVTAFRYKSGDEEVEIVTAPAAEESMEDQKDTSPTNLVGFHVHSFDDMEE